jgi:hypothetical protein
MPDKTAEATARAIAAAHGNRPDELIEILHVVQSEIGYVPEAVVPALAEVLNLSRAEVHGVVTFYHDFRAKPAGRHVLKLCRASPKPKAPSLSSIRTNNAGRLCITPNEVSTGVSTGARQTQISTRVSLTGPVAASAAGW